MSRLAVAALFAAFTLTACNKAPEAPAAPAAPAAPVAPAAPATAAAAQQVKPGESLSVAAIDVGTDVGVDNRVNTSLDTFKASDTIIASIMVNNTSAAPVDGNIGVRWTGPDGQVFNEEAQAKPYPAGANAITFRVADPKGLKLGKYKVEATLNTSAVQSKEFSVK
jgi:hypothetical protein